MEYNKVNSAKISPNMRPTDPVVSAVAKYTPRAENYSCEWRYGEFYIRAEVSNKPGKRWFISWGEYIQAAVPLPGEITQTNEVNPLQPNLIQPQGGSHAYTNGAAALIATQAFENFPLSYPKQSDFYQHVLAFLDELPWPTTQHPSNLPRVTLSPNGQS